MQRIDSTHSTWWFDTEVMRFCRLPKGVAPAQPALEREWQPYFGLDLDVSGAFTVALNPDHTRLLRAYREDAPEMMAEEVEPTTELHLVVES
ncbi:MAG: hypothetical protein U0W40_08600 [Acidimicrobiia bacterium]